LARSLYARLRPSKKGDNNDNIVEILKDEKVLKQSEIFMENVHEKMDICFDKGVAFHVVNIESYVKGYKKMKERMQK
jgi:hypothetical protein